MSKNYGPCRAIGDQTFEVDGRKIVWEFNRLCHCNTPMAAMFCSFGHMLECHYPMRCLEAKCDHLSRYEE